MVTFFVIFIMFVYIKKEDSFFNLRKDTLVMNPGKISLHVKLMFLALMSLSALYSQTLDSILRSHIELRFGMFMHFNMNTFSPGWGNDRVDPQMFAPASLNCNQWAAAAKAAKMTYGVLTTKHHDGFTLWPSKQVPPNGKVPYTIKQSSVPDKDIVKEYVTAFRAQGLLPGLYFSMWDVANGVTGGSEAELQFVLGQLTELLGGYYGEIPILMIDGWDWKMGHKAISYQAIRDTVKKMQPQCLLTDMNGLMSPWEVDIIFVEEPKGLYCPEGNKYAACQSPSISGDWFWDASAANVSSLMSKENILSHLTNLQSRYCNFLLNCPPNRSGVLDAAIVTRLAEVGGAWTPDASRAPLPPQPLHIEYPITPVSATASSGTAANAIDGYADCFGSTQLSYCTNPGQTLWTSSGALPQWITMDLGATIQNIGIVGYLPQAAANDGQITNYTVLLSTNNSTFTIAATGAWPANRDYKTVTFTPAAARYVRLTANAVSNGSAAIASEVDCGVILATQVGFGKRLRSLNAPRERIFTITNNEFTIPGEISDKRLLVSVYDLSGRLLQSANLKGKTLSFKNKARTAQSVYIIAIKPEQ
jgi:alpha-L-fucosidase